MSAPTALDYEFTLQACYHRNMSAHAPLSPKMTDALEWLHRENLAGHNVNTHGRTIDALIRRGLVELVPGQHYGTPVRVTDAGRAAVSA